MNRRTRRTTLALSVSAAAVAGGVAATTLPAGGGGDSGNRADSSSAHGSSGHAGTGALSALGGPGSTARTDGTTFAGSLNGANEVPVPGGPAVGDKDGRALAVMRVDGTKVSFRFTYRGIAAPTAAHLHQGAKGQNGDIRIPFFAKKQPDGRSSVSGTVRVTDAALLEQLRTNPGGFYFNLHTGEFPGGAVRGQVNKLTAQHSDAGLKSAFQASVVRGAQVYRCVDGAFVQDNVRARLGGGIAHFFAKAGPQGPPKWLAKDRSAVTGRAVARIPNGEGNIPELDLLATQDGARSGLLARTNEILRLNTVGGVAPSGMCENGKRAAVPYKADYVFLNR